MEMLFIHSAEELGFRGTQLQNGSGLGKEGTMEIFIFLSRLGTETDI